MIKSDVGVPQERAAVQPSGAIAFLLPDMGGGGAERVVADLANGFLAKGWPVDVVLGRRQGELLDELAPEIRIVDLEARRTRHLFWPLVRYLRRRKPAAVIANMWPLTSVAVAAHIVALSKARLIVVDHSALSKQYHSRSILHHCFLAVSTGVTYRFAAERVTVSAGVADDLSKISRIDRSHFSVVYNPIPPRKYIKPVINETIAGEWKRHAGPKLIAVGKLKSQKNHDLLLRSFAQLPKSLNAQLLILGEGPLRVHLEQLAGALDVHSAVLFPGFVKDPTLFYESADLFVLSSDYEGFGNVIVEALASGVPVVSTDCVSGPAEILAQGQFGTLVPVGDANALSSAIVAALSQPRDPAVLKARAAEFSLERALKAYEAVISNPSTRG